MTASHLDPTVRHDMVFLFDVVDGNPTGTRTPGIARGWTTSPGRDWSPTSP